MQITMLQRFLNTFLLALISARRILIVGRLLFPHVLTHYLSYHLSFYTKNFKTSLLRMPVIPTHLRGRNPSIQLGWWML